MTIWISWELPLFIFRVSIYDGPHTYTWVKGYGRFNFLRAYLFNFERLNILCAWIGDPSKMLWPVEFLDSLCCSFSSVSIYHCPHTCTRVKSYGRLNLPRAYVFNIEHLDILWAWIGHPSEKLWPFEFLESFHSSFLSICKYHGLYMYTRVKSYGRLSLPRASIVHFRVFRYIMGLTHRPKSKVMAIWICWDLTCSISSILIYYVPES